MGTLLLLVCGRYEKEILITGRQNGRAGYWWMEEEENCGKKNYRYYRARSHVYIIAKRLLLSSQGVWVLREQGEGSTARRVEKFSNIGSGSRKTCGRRKKRGSPETVAVLASCGRINALRGGKCCPLLLSSTAVIRIVRRACQPPSFPFFTFM